MLLQNVYWSLGTAYPSYEAFVQEATDYNNRINPNHQWDPEKVVVPQAKASIYYEAMWKDEDDLLVIEIASQDGLGIKMGELLFKINNDSVDFFAEAGSMFFEGLNPIREEDGVALFSMWIGT